MHPFAAFYSAILETGAQDNLRRGGGLQVRTAPRPTHRRFLPVFPDLPQALPPTEGTGLEFRDFDYF
jgi:hypothetical protein